MNNGPVRIDDLTPMGRSAKVTSATDSDNKKKQKKSRKKLFTMVAGVVIFIALLVAGWCVYRGMTTNGVINGGEYQAVFFTNGQVYFGKLESENNGYLKLTNVFYIQSKSIDSTNPQQASSQQSSDLQLIKLGAEVHGPDDAMIINKDQVLFFENLKPDGKVAASITKYYSGK